MASCNEDAFIISNILYFGKACDCIIKILPPQTQPMEGSEGGMGFAMKEKQALTREYAPRRRQALTLKEKTGILGEYIRLTRYHRKYSLALLKWWGKEIFLTVDGKPVKLKACSAKQRKKIRLRTGSDCVHHDHLGFLLAITPGTSENPAFSRLTPSITAENGTRGSFASAWTPPTSLPGGSNFTPSSLP
jgi:hypothetical protein